MTRRLGLALLLAAALATSAGVASGKPRGPRDPQRHYNAADQAWARAIRVQRADLGVGWKAETTSNDDTGAPAACRNPDLSDLVATGEAENPDYSRDGSLVGSGSAVFRNERDARAAWDRVSRQPLEQCALSAFKKGMTGTGAKLHVVSSGRPALPNLTPGFRAYRLRFTVKASGTTLSGRLGYYVFWRGRADAALFLISLDRPLQPISPALERKLAELMAQRMRR